MKSLLIAALATAILAISGNAAIPRETELELQARAPEQLEIKIVTVKKKRRGGRYEITATGKVLKVRQSAAGLAADAELRIKYSVPARPIPGAPPAVVQKGKHYAAFLSKADGGGHFCPAAASGSFDLLANDG